MEATAGAKTQTGDSPWLVWEAAGAQHGRRGESRWELITCEARGATRGQLMMRPCAVLERGCGKVPWPGAGTGWLPTAVSKSITPSTDFRLVYLECKELACQTSALAIKHAMVTIALPCVSATRIGNNHKCQKRERMEKESCAKPAARWLGWRLHSGALPAAPSAAPAGGRGIDVALASSCPFC